VALRLAGDGIRPKRDSSPTTASIRDARIATPAARHPDQNDTTSLRDSQSAVLEGLHELPFL
jgi:hypothetical protein